MKSLKLIFDIDGTLRNTPQAICDVYRIFFDLNSSITPELIFSYNLKDVFPLISSIPDFFDVFSKELFFESKPYPDAANLIQNLYQNHFVHLVTDQPKNKEFLTELWARKTGVLYHDFHSTPDKYLVKYADFIVDDKPEILKKYKEENKNSKTIIIDQAYNKNFKADFRVKPSNLLEILNIIN